ncbi:hypothetical protein KKG65_00845 [Patescibacteria group bacterium]|nr:hypothetical protein [Patescibacteria group bacterium]MBU1200443.1 hypothetical protein [Patescibacteria group bacterium]MBU1256063.1 hypothetical protein [Patescibacteria group bacterium]MBU1457275.1 hypothetical protein [Patescibacteria group bacterium]
MSEKYIDNNVGEVRKIVRGYLENLVLGGKMELDKAKEIAREANGLLVVKTINSWQELIEAIGRLKVLFSDQSKLWEMLIFEAGLENKKNRIDEQVIPKVTQGDLDGALDLLDLIEKA